MREWALTVDDPYSLHLSADARLCTPTYTDDQTWEVTLHGMDPPAVGLETTYGLRAQAMRIFPSFFTQGTVVCDPRSFAEPVLIRRFLVSYVRLECKPTQSLWTEMEYWVPDSHTIAGRFTLQNQSRADIELRLRLQAVLRAHLNDADDAGEAVHRRLATGGMRAESISGATVLTGLTDGLAPVVFLSGGAW
jgi:hypothetical protein